MNASEKFNAVKKACEEKRVCQLNFKDERRPRYIHPLGICLTYKRGLVIVCRVEETDQLNKNNDPLISNLPIEDCHHIRLTDRRFHVLPDFFKQAEVCDDWLFYVKPAAG
jgi:hypothetical protein